MKQLLSVITGSQAYGTNTPESDLDLSDIYAQTPDKLLGLGTEYIPHIQHTKDHKGFEIRRFIELLNVANPTTLEMLFSPKDCILLYDDSLDVLFQNRQMFLTKECIKTFGGMAVTQIEKATNTDKMMNWEEKRVERRTILDFCTAIADGQTIGIKDWLDWYNKKPDDCGLVKLNHAPGAYAIYFGSNYKGIGDEKSNEVRLSSIPKGEESVGTMFFNKDAYSKHCSDYKKYQEWLKNRNMDRLKVNKNHNQLCDSKNLAHSYRLVQMSREIVETGDLLIRRPLAEVSHFLKIKKGEINLFEIIDWVKKEISELKIKYENSSLPDKPDMIKANEMLLEIRNNITYDL